jgi:hypothetical protein
MQLQRREVRKKAEDVFLLLLAIRNGLLNFSRYTWPIKSSQDSLGTTVSKAIFPASPSPVDSTKNVGKKIFQFRYEER